MTESDLDDLLRAYYAPPTWALLLGVRNQTGFAHGTIRTADAIAMSLFLTRGLLLYGIEVKTIRSDWLRELKNPEKAEAIAQYCDGWIIAAPKGVVDPKELPPAWGLLEPFGKTMRMMVAPKNQESPKTIDRPFLAALLRAVNTQSPKERELRDAKQKGMWEGGERAKEEAKWKIKHVEQERDAWKDAVEGFEKASGVKIKPYSGPHLGALFQDFVNYRNGIEYTDAEETSLKKLSEFLRQTDQDVNKRIAALKGLKEIRKPADAPHA